MFSAMQFGFGLGLALTNTALNQTDIQISGSAVPGGTLTITNPVNVYTLMDGGELLYDNAELLAYGATPGGYQWYINNIPIAGETDIFFTIPMDAVSGDTVRVNNSSVLVITEQPLSLSAIIYREKKWATAMSRGKVGGAYGMNLFDTTNYLNDTEANINSFHNAHDPGEDPYPLNPNLWCNEIRDLLTCCSVHKDDCGTGEGGAGEAWRSRYGVVAITKRHVLGCAHAFSHAQGTWPTETGISTPPTRIRFIGNDGLTVDRILLHQAVAVGADLHVGVLNEDLPDSVYIPKVAPSTKLNELIDYEAVILSQEWQPQSGLYYNSTSIGQNVYRAKVPAQQSDGLTITHVLSGNDNISVTVSGQTITVYGAITSTTQQIRNAVNASAANSLVTAVVDTAFLSYTAVSGTNTMLWTILPASDYPILNRQMFWIYPNPSGSWGPIGPEGFRYSAYSGDSGTPVLVKLQNELVVAGIVSGYSSLYDSPATITWPERLNAIIQAADAKAISLGRLATSTGYTVTPYPYQIL